MKEMHELPKPVRKLLREAMSEAYRRELRVELTRLHQSFDQWSRGDLTEFDLTDIIHKFHNGPNRELFTQYSGGRDALMHVAFAVCRGVFRLEELDPLLHQFVGEVVERVRAVK